MGGLAIGVGQEDLFHRLGAILKVPINAMRLAVFVAERFFGNRLGFAQIVPRQVGKEMMLDMEVEIHQQPIGEDRRVIA